MVSLDVLTMGRISVDVYPLQVGVSLREVESFGKYLGGSSTNVAVASARYGHRVATITRTGADPFGEFLHDALKGFGWTIATSRRSPASRPRSRSARSSRPTTSRSTSTAASQGAGHGDPRGRARLRRDPRRARVLGHGHRPLRRAEPQRHARRARGARQVRHHRARPRLPADVLGVARDRARVGRPRARARTVAVGNLDEPTPPSASASRAPPLPPCASAGSSWRWSSRGRRACWPTTGKPPSKCRPCRSRSSTASGPATRSAARSATGC